MKLRRIYIFDHHNMIINDIKIYLILILYIHDIMKLREIMNIHYINNIHKNIENMILISFVNVFLFESLSKFFVSFLADIKILRRIIEVISKFVLFSLMNIFYIFIY